jgi:hypothetical protein
MAGKNMPIDVPDFTDEGVLPPGDYPLSIEEIKSSKLVLGPGVPTDHPTWDASWRLKLVESLTILVDQLFSIGIIEVYINGSFVEYKDHPNDVDGYFPCDLRRLASGTLQRELNLLDPFKVWTWDPASRTPFRGYPKWQLPMWHRYRVELYPHCGLPSGIKDHNGHDLEFPAAFRRRRSDGMQKGIVRIGGPSIP